MFPLVLCFFLVFHGWAHAEPVHGLAMYGKPALEADFKHLPYSNPQAPKRGRFVVGAQGSFDTLNPYTIRGTTTPWIKTLLYDTLLVRNYDEPFSVYGRIAKTVELGPNRSWIIFNIHEKAQFETGDPITAEDVAFTFELLREKGQPNHRLVYKKVASYKIISKRSIRFDMPEKVDWELPLVIGLMPVFSKKSTDVARFEEVNLNTRPIGSGPYRVSNVKAGETIVLTRDPNYWGKDLPFAKGFYNFDTFQIDFYKDGTSLFEAFRTGLIDYRLELDPEKWIKDYNFDDIKSEKIIKMRVQTKAPSFLPGFLFNTRRDIFKNIHVREAISVLYDFHWLNRTYYDNLYKPLLSFFQNSTLSFLGTKPNQQEKSLLKKSDAKPRPETLKGYSPYTYFLKGKPPANFHRLRLERALQLFSKAGYKLEKGVLIGQDKKPLIFEVLTSTREQMRLALSLKDFLSKVGINISIRNTDPAQYRQRLQNYDFDMVQNNWCATSLSPGNERYACWGSKAGAEPGSNNLPYVHDPAVDRLIDALVSSRHHEDLVSAARALDRTLMSGFYWIPLFHFSEWWIARKFFLSIPLHAPAYGYFVETWWDNGKLSPSPTTKGE